MEAGEASGTPCFVRLRADGSREPFAFGRHGDGGALDADGRIYMAGGGPIVSIYEPDGTLVEELHLPEGVRITTKLCFGGADLRTLFVTDPRRAVPRVRVDGDAQSRGSRCTPGRSPDGRSDALRDRAARNCFHNPT